MIKVVLSFAAALLGHGAVAAAEPPPRSLDQALVETLSLGDDKGCGSAFGITPADITPNGLDSFLVGLRDADTLGKELAAICGSSAVTSAAALGGSLGSLQTTKTVSQFRVVRNRADSRLDARGKRVGLGLDRPVLLAQLGGGPAGAASISTEPAADPGPGAFVHLAHERRDRVTTALEAGYRAGIDDALIGFDYSTRNNLVAGAWVGYRRADADYRVASPQIGGSDAGFGASLDPALRADICKIGPGGGFDDKGARFGAFVAKRFGAGFADVGVQYSRRDYRYSRNVCAIEAQGALEPDPNSPSGFRDSVRAVDDIYAGTISGKARLTEAAISARVGFDLQAEPFQWGPRLSLTWLRTTLGAYTETGRTSVTNRVESNTPIVLFTDRAAGDPTGLELAFDRQRRTSLQSELQLVANARHETAFGVLVPRVAVGWVHEFKGERQLVNVRMAQDLRATPTRFTFTTDSVDKNKATLALGVSLLRGAQFAADLEVTRLVGDDRFDSTSVAFQAIFRF